MAKIITIPNPLLREKSKEIQVFDKKIQDLADELRKTLIDHEKKIKGVGLSAVQIGVLKRIFIVYSQSSKQFLTFINPQIIWFSKRLTDSKKGRYEGCLSVPGKWAKATRSKEVKVRYQTESGTPQVRKFSGLTATIIQHEYDHLEGILFIDRALEQKAKIYEIVKDEKGKESLQEVKLT